MKYYKGLDALRTFAVLFVIIEHWILPAHSHTILESLRSLFIPHGGFGVNLFFCLSGFLITGILLEAKFHSGNSNGIIIKNFIIRRSLRIFPLYYVTLILLFAVNYPQIREDFIYFATYTSNILSYKNHAWNTFSHTWSLSVEEQFYLIWPWLIIYADKKYLKMICIAFVCIGVCTTFVSMYFMHGFAPILANHCFDAFGLGGLYALSKYDDASLVKFKSALKFLFPAALIIYLYWRLAEVGLFTGFGELYFSRIIDSIIAIWLIHAAITTESGRIKKYILDNSILIEIGKISYGIYLFHYIIPAVYHKLIEKLATGSILTYLGNAYIAFVLQLFIVVILSYLSFELFEKRITALKRYFNYSAQ